MSPWVCNVKVIPIAHVTMGMQCKSNFHSRGCYGNYFYIAGL